MQAVVLAAGEGTRLRPLTEDKPKALVEVDGRPILSHCFDRLIELDADELLVVVGYKKERIIDFYGDDYGGVPITYTHQREPKGLAHALLCVEEHVDDDFMLMLGDNVFEANLADVVNRQREDRADVDIDSPGHAPGVDDDTVAARPLADDHTDIELIGEGVDQIGRKPVQRGVGPPADADREQFRRQPVPLADFRDMAQFPERAQVVVDDTFAHIQFGGQGRHAGGVDAAEVFYDSERPHARFHPPVGLVFHARY